MFSIGEINVICSSLERSLAFYRDVLGFDFVEEEAGAVRLSCRGRDVLLLPFAAAAEQPSVYCSRPTISLDLYVESIETAHRHLTGKGIIFERDWQPPAKHFHIRDPDGLVWEVIEN